jgi:hypothetical protein
MSSLPAQSHLGTLQRLLFALVEYGFVVWLSRAEQVVDDSGKLVSCSGDRLRFAELVRQINSEDPIESSRPAARRGPHRGP